MLKENIMANYLLAIDPVLLLSKRQFNKISEDYKSLEDNGASQDAIKDEISKSFEFADVFQSTNDVHNFKAHEFLLADKTGQHGMHDIGQLKTPSDLLAFVSVDDEWLKEHPNEAKAGSYIKLDDRIDPKKLHANDGATKDGRSAGFIRYDNYKTPVMAVLPEGPIDENETVEEMEREADKREGALRARKSKLSTIHNAYKMAQQGSSLDAFLTGWKLIDQLHAITDERQQEEYARQHPQAQSPAEPNSHYVNDDTQQKEYDRLQEQHRPNESSYQPTETSYQPKETSYQPKETSYEPNEMAKSFDNGLNELSIESMLNNEPASFNPNDIPPEMGM